MHLKSLTLKGFKSFASATTLRFEPGITCVVGPNGSGKSNVVDAIAWVLGEQGAKALRGGKMDDVIFAGTAGRAPLGRAEVTLTIDNSDGALPIDYTEVSLTRRLFRTGESEYEINGDSCRLLDIQELLSDSGIGREMHVIVGQGQLDSVLQARPEDRRGFIEEAAGVLNQPAIRTVFDLGGNAGNVFYRYDAYMGLPSDLRWTVCDLAKNIEFAETYARDRQEGRLRFTTEPAELDGCDLLLASGSLHYFENPLAMVSAASRRPAFILVNRSPLTERDSFSVVQDVGDWLVACVVHNRARLYQGLQGLGYELRDEWTAPEFHIEVAGSPALSVPAYSGFFMALRDRLGGSQPARKRDA